MENSSKKVAKEIAIKTKELDEIKNKMQQYQDQFTILKAKIALHQENQEAIHEKLQKMKMTKNEYFEERDSLIDRKRVLQRELSVDDSSTSYHTLNEQISKLSDEISNVIEKSKSLSSEMQQLYQNAQVEQKEMKLKIEELKSKQYESQNVMNMYQQQITEIEKDLTKLRRKMSDINKKLKKEG